MVIDTTRSLFRFIISALSATACIFPNRETVGDPVEPLPAALPDRCLRALPDHGHIDGLSDRSRFW